MAPLFLPSSPMNRWLRRVIYFLIIIIWLLVMAFPVLAVVLATRDQIQLGNDPQSQIRLFLLQEPDTRGVGLEWTRRSGTPGCAQTTLTYLLWEGSGENSTYCRCYNTSGALLDSYPGSCPS